MNEEHSIVQRVYDAKNNMEVADLLIMDYIPFIKAQASKVMKRAVDSTHDDEFSIAMIAFHEAINGYSKTKGNFLSYASLLIRNRLIDYWRKNNRHNQVISIDAPLYGEDSETTMLDNHQQEKEMESDLMVIREATKEEINELSEQMSTFGVTLTDIAENSPKQDRTLRACQQVVSYARENEEMMDYFFRTKQLPLAQLVEQSKVARKTIERHRKYIVALLLIYSNGYEIIRGHLAEVMKGVTAK